MIHNVPFELQRLTQWVCAGENKLPLNPKTGQAADVTNPATWGTFEEALACNMRHVGFVLSKADPYTIIDLDDPRKNSKGELEQDAELVKARTRRHCKILEAFESYAEFSQSQNGIHIVVKGSIPKGCRRDRVEVYSDSRYMICTGNVYKNIAITEQQPLLDALFSEMSTERETVELVQVDSMVPDDEICRMGFNASNGAKFWDLWQGKWQGKYESQSEADFALMSIIAFYTKDNEQVRRIFRSSELGKRDKATRNDKYLNYALAKIRANELPMADLSELLAKAAQVKQQYEYNKTGQRDTVGGATANTAAEGSGTGEQADTETEQEPQGGKGVSKEISYPEGFVGELAEYFFANAIRPVREIALAGAIALTAGVVGRCYNISGTGLNQYIILLAKTGSGKEGIAKGINRMINAVRPVVPMADQFLGPAKFASGQALVRVVAKQPCFVSVLGEFGLTLQDICDPKVTTNGRVLKQVLLDLYSKSGWDDLILPTAYSDTEKNTTTVQAPCMTIIGESTPETFYDGLSQTHIAEGLVPRFSVIEYNGERPERNTKTGQPPPEPLRKQFEMLVHTALSAQQNRAHCDVQMDADAQALLDGFDKEADAKIKGSAMDIGRQLWNRAHLKALKMAALLAVGCNPTSPLITEEQARWAVEFVRSEIANMARKFGDGEIGMGDQRQESDVRRIIEDYLSMNKKARVIYKVPETILDKALIPYGYLKRRALPLASFKIDRRGANAALDATLANLTKSNTLAQVPPALAYTQFKIKAPLYVLGNEW